MIGVKCERRIYNSLLNTHAHPYAQLILPMHGMLHIETRYKKLALEPEHLFFLPPDCEHAFRGEQRNEFLVLDIAQTMTNKADMEKMAGGRVLPFDDKWKAIRYLLLNEADNGQSSTSINHLFLFCYKLLAEGAVPDSINYINEHFAEDIDLKKLAAIEHYNPSYYSEWFKNITQVSPIEYIQRVRIKKAKELLLNTDLTILQITQMIGYKHHSSLTRLFKELEQTTPLEFRSKSKR